MDYARMLSGMEIGTEATRAAIIDKATKRRVNAQQAQQMLLVFFMR